MTPAGFPHSDTPGSTLGCQLPRAYRRLLRPSSALDAKASTMCPSQLVTHTTNPTHHQKPETRNNKKAPPSPHPPEDDQKTSRAKETGTDDEPDVAVHTTHYKRCSRPLSRSQTTTPHPHHPTTTAEQHEPGPWNRSPRHAHHPRSHPPEQHTGLIPQNPNSVPPPSRRTGPGREADDSTSETPPTPTTLTHQHSCWQHGCRTGCVLLRKEVIQPHLPVRLPCYDFVPIASPTFDHSPHTRWLGHGLRVLPTFVT